MNKTIKEGEDLIVSFKRRLYNIENIDIVLCPPYTLLSSLSDMLISSNIKLGAQDLFWENKGAYTGKISASQLKDVGCQYVIIGHSERRHYFGETDEMVNKKIKAAIKSALVPIVCVGETLSQREQNQTFEVIKGQIQEGFKDFSQEEIKNLVIAYEPVWAIGTGRNATAEQAEEVQVYIRNLLAQIYDKDIAQGIRIQYGGSVKPENIEQLIQQPDIDGALVGGASLEADSFTQIIEKCIPFS